MSDIDVNTVIEMLRDANAKLKQLNDGETIIVPKNVEHAENMIRVGSFYLETYSANDAITKFLNRQGSNNNDVD